MPPCAAVCSHTRRPHAAAPIPSSIHNAYSQAARRAVTPSLAWRQRRRQAPGGGSRLVVQAIGFDLPGAEMNKSEGAGSLGLGYVWLFACIRCRLPTAARSLSLPLPPSARPREDC